ncbi:DUF3566 domain-containing protein [Actinoplanes xinjiangensis]|uniref:Transmembrane protein DUF3566 n=1 Tax=Actinoplanes xinjiangensis TaxID=512350 RepID=A0A316EH04_9ACTN|nr:DUF3566 domain-containing protein [Actinoplanes xinjiangensis]PWK30324.1 transmembrane protein DUF3566 [Actinoplanes xinjiangensis]GIF44422.1 hypothetical protein Axi01nite_87330 [Actinoplanes xinjiangensis]
MPETQAKSGGPGTSATPDDAAKKDAAAPAGRESTGRASVPADAPSPPKFTRAPGMAPPPGEPAAGNTDGADPKRPGAQPPVKGSASVPVVTKGKGAAPGSTSGRTPVSAPAATAAGTPPRPTNPPAPQAAAPGAAKQRTGSTPTAGGAAAVGAARVSEAVRSARSTVSSAAARGPRRARLNLKRIDPWSVMKFSFAVSIVLFIVVVVATSVLYLALDTMGVWSSVNGNLQELVTASGGTEGSTTSAFRITAWGVIGTSMLIGAVNVVLFTALATLGAFIYNVCADLVGGIELTLAERD